MSPSKAEQARTDAKAIPGILSQLAGWSDTRITLALAALHDDWRDWLRGNPYEAKKSAK